MSSGRGRFRASRASRPPRSGAAPRAAAGPLAELRRLQEGNGSSQFPPGSRLLSLNFAPSREEGVEGCEGRFEEILESQEPLAIKQKTAKEVKKNLIGCGSNKLRGDEKKGRAKAGGMGLPANSKSSGLGRAPHQEASRPRAGGHAAAGEASRPRAGGLAAAGEARSSSRSSSRDWVARSRSRHPATRSRALGGARARDKENLATGPGHQGSPLPWDTASSTGLPWRRAAKVVALEPIRSLQSV